MRSIATVRPIITATVSQAMILTPGSDVLAHELTVRSYSAHEDDHERQHDAVHHLRQHDDVRERQVRIRSYAGSGHNQQG